MADDYTRQFIDPYHAGAGICNIGNLFREIGTICNSLGIGNRNACSYNNALTGTLEPVTAFPIQNDPCGSGLCEYFLSGFLCSPVWSFSVRPCGYFSPDRRAHHAPVYHIPVRISEPVF